MNFRVVVLARAEAELRLIANWLSARSPAGAIQWLEAFEAAKDTVARNPFLCELAPENEFVDIEVRQVLFKTSRGNRYRALFTVFDTEVRILHIRGPGQPLLDVDEF